MGRGYGAETSKTINSEKAFLTGAARSVTHIYIVYSKRGIGRPYSIPEQTLSKLWLKSLTRVVFHILMLSEIQCMSLFSILCAPASE